MAGEEGGAASTVNRPRRRLVRLPFWSAPNERRASKVRRPLSARRSRQRQRAGKRKQTREEGSELQRPNSAKGRKQNGSREGHTNSNARALPSRAELRPGAPRWSHMATRMPSCVQGSSQLARTRRTGMPVHYLQTRHATPSSVFSNSRTARPLKRNRKRLTSRTARTHRELPHLEGVSRVHRGELALQVWPASPLQWGH